jgi:hypothetical protein
MRQKKDQLFHVGSNKRKHDRPSSPKPPKKTFKKDVPKSKGKEELIWQFYRQNACHFCEKESHYKKDYPDFLKWMMKKGID